MGLNPALDRARGLALARRVDEIMVIGGAEIFAQLAGVVDRMYWTQVHASPRGDTWFPPFDKAAWTQVGREVIAQGAKDQFAATLLILERVKV